jgi:hypothetical protein
MSETFSDERTGLCFMVVEVSYHPVSLGPNLEGYLIIFYCHRVPWSYFTVPDSRLHPREPSPAFITLGTGRTSNKPRHWVPFIGLLRLAGLLLWRYSNSAPHRLTKLLESKSKKLRPTISRPINLGVKTQLAHATAFMLLSDICGLVVSGHSDDRIKNHCM